MIIKIVYTLFLALLVALFVGLGIDAFYPGPASPEYPVELNKIGPVEEETAEEKRIQEEIRGEYDQKQKEYQKQEKTYNRNVSILSLGIAILILILSLAFLGKIKMMADGILLGGVFTTAYSIIRGLMSDDSRFRFAIVTAGLLIALVLGYIKFIRPKEKTE